MASLSKYLANKFVDLMRGQAFTYPATEHYAYFTSTHGPRANSTAYSVANTISVVSNDGKTNLYRCTTAGTTAATQSTLYPGASNEIITDGSAVFTEQTTGIKDGSALVECTGGGYARVAVAGSLANYAGTQGAGTTTASTGASNTTSNNAAITQGGTASANLGFLWGWGTYDAASAGNLLWVDGLGAAKTVNNGDPFPSLAIGAHTRQVDSV
jgi:hypothetical protein